jgi:hypothetical protein
MTEKGFDGMRVLALENRRATEIATLIRNYGGVPRAHGEKCWPRSMQPTRMASAAFELRCRSMAQ